MTHHREGERGQVIVITALFLVVLLAAGALAVDYSSWLVARRDYQAVVDAAALAGAAELPAAGVAAASLGDRQNAAIEALVYLSNHLGWGITQTDAASAVDQFLQMGAPYVPPRSGYCVWIWTPVPTSTDTTTPDARCEPNSSTLYSPPTFAGDGHKVFVRVQSLRPAYLSGVVGIRNELVSAIAVGGGAVNNFAVISLKTRLGNPDNVLGLTLNGDNTSLIVPIGNVGGNYSAKCSGASNTHAIDFPVSTLGQQIVVNEPPPTASCTNANVTGGTIQQLGDYPIPDPAYFVANGPTWCTGPNSGECQEPAVSGTADWPYAPASVYPGCATGSDPSQNKITNCTGAFMVYPGKYEYISVPNGATATLSPNCYGDPADLILYPGHTTPDSDCIAKGRAGVFYFNSNAATAGLSVGNGGTLNGCGVLTVFDPNENGASARVQFSAGTGAVVRLNDPTVPGGCAMKYDNGTGPTGTRNYAWYGYNAPYQNPVTMWVRPNGNYGNNGASDVITFTGQAALFEGGAIYAPMDNTQISGGPSGSGVGQIVAWTITYSGGTNITESFQGPAKIRTRLWQ